MTEPVRMVPIQKAIQLAALKALTAGAQADEACAGSPNEAEALALEAKFYARMRELKTLAASGVKEIPAGDGE